MKKSLVGANIALVYVIAAFVLAPLPSADAQSGSRTRGGASVPFEVRFWNWLTQVQYRKWAVPAGKDRNELYPGESPHGALLRVYLNETAAAHPKELPPGSIIVKENYSKDRQLKAVTVMYRSKGFDPQHRDWWYGKYMPNGQIATMKMEGSGRVMKLAGSVQSCVKCHSSADGDDYAFFND